MKQNLLGHVTGFVPALVLCFNWNPVVLIDYGFLPKVSQLMNDLYINQYELRESDYVGIYVFLTDRVHKKR